MSNPYIKKVIQLSLPVLKSKCRGGSSTRVSVYTLLSLSIYAHLHDFLIVSIVTY